jgi:hypothetical protein
MQLHSRVQHLEISAYPEARQSVPELLTSNGEVQLPQNMWYFEECESTPL